MADRHLPTSTYRLQLHAGFGFDAAAAIVPYLSRLGVSHLYLSPILQAAPGSMHGYDVVDHGRVSDDLGGEAALLRLAEQAHESGLGIVVDLVPNHMAMPSPEFLNRPLWQTLRDGRDSSFAHWFDVDWDALDGRIGLPILGSPLDELLAAGELSLGEHEGEPVLRYGDHVLPIAEGSLADDVETTLQRQHYRLGFWRDKADLLNYRRFFDVDTLVAIRVELDDVFDASHATLFDLHERGVVDGFRIDHPDGLADPQGYLQRLHSVVGDRWVVVEKILEPAEALPTAWQCAGTTGYDAIRAVQSALAPPVADELTHRWADVGGEASYRATELEAKQQVIRDLFQPEVARLAALATRAAGDESGLDRPTAAEALTAMLAHVAVYRAYLRPGVPADPDALHRLHDMCTHAAGSRPDLAEPIAALQSMLADTATTSEAARELVVRFQQVCGPVMAKGVEDTTYYRWHRLVALNEVGGDPLALDSPHRDHLHTWARHQAAEHPFGMTALSTHDTKRNEDARARLLAVVEDLAGWDAVSDVVLAQAAECGVDRPTGYFVAQTLIAAWPLSEERLRDYLLKAIREAKQHTTWNDPDEDYQSRVEALAGRCLADPVRSTVERVLGDSAEAVRVVTLAAKLLQLTLPGVPDVYQGTELADPTLVDPDNRRPVDFDRREGLLAGLDAEPRELPADLDAQKLWLTSTVLRLRRDRPELFDAVAGYRAAESASPHVLAFLRGTELATVVTRWPGRLARSGWGDATVSLPTGDWTDVLTGRPVSVDTGTVRAADLLMSHPVALLVRAPR